MSVYRDKRSPFYSYDFQFRGHRFHGSTKCKDRREAEKVERAERDKAKRQLAQQQTARMSLRLDDVADRYWNEVGQHHKGADNTERLLGLIVDYFGKDRLITDITGDDVAKLVAWRRGHRVIRSKKRKPEGCPLISAFTVNDTTEQLKKLFTRAKRAWGARLDNEPSWKDHWLEEPQERVRELVGDEGDQLEAAARDDYWPLFDFARATGLRKAQCLGLLWTQVNWDARQIVVPGKRGRTETAAITSEVREILWPLRGHHPERVFTYVARRNRKGLIKGRRYPLTRSGLNSYWKRLRKRAKVAGFRFHDFRHDHLTKLLRATGNLKLVQRAGNHQDIKTTARYAHVLDDELAAAQERLAESRKKSRKPLREVS